MMWIVILALKRPYTFVCASLLVFIFGIFAIVKMAVDVFPVIPMPVATVVWYYTGMAPQEMEGRMIQSAQRFYSSVANDIEHIESSTYNGVGVIKIYFQPDADVAMIIVLIYPILSTSGPNTSLVAVKQKKYSVSRSAACPAAKEYALSRYIMSHAAIPVSQINPNARINIVSQSAGFFNRAEYPTLFLVCSNLIKRPIAAGTTGTRAKLSIIRYV